MGRDPGAAHALDLRASVASGDVALAGTVPSLAAKWRAGRLVGGFKGVSALRNALVVGGPPRSDADVARDVSDALKRDPATRHANLRAAAKAGAVAITGTVDSFTQRDLVAEAAARVPGVKELTLPAVSMSAPRSEAEIAADITDTLRDDARLDGGRVAVTVHGRRASVSGVAGSLAQWDAAEEDAWPPGVEAVDGEALR